MKTLELRITFDEEQKEFAEAMYKLDSLIMELKEKYPDTKADLYTNAMFVQ
jgi:hypothetical protein